MTQNFQKIHTKADKKNRKKEPNSRSMQRRQAFFTRRAMRQAELGRVTEDRVEKLLAKKLEADELISYERFAPNSPEDCQGKDFRVTQETGIQKERITASFGITISLKSHQEHQWLHPEEPSILIPPEMRDERIWYRICQICEKQTKNARAQKPELYIFYADFQAKLKTNLKVSAISLLSIITPTSFPL